MYIAPYETVNPRKKPKTIQMDHAKHSAQRHHIAQMIRNMIGDCKIFWKHISHDTCGVQTKFERYHALVQIQ